MRAMRLTNVSTANASSMLAAGRKPWMMRIRPTRRGSLYVAVNVWPTRKSMLAYLRAEYDRRTPANTLGMCSDFKIQRFLKNRPMRTLPIVCEVNLCAGHIGTSVITHEFFHATMAYARRCKLMWERLAGSDVATEASHEEEWLARIHGTMCAKFVDRAARAGFYSAKQLHENEDHGAAA